ncbi:hypothetical protein DV736_g5400, partial [Chaetothyriales sp. CBS 134916]
MLPGPFGVFGAALHASPTATTFDPDHILDQPLHQCLRKCSRCQPAFDLRGPLLLVLVRVDVGVGNAFAFATARQVAGTPSSGSRRAASMAPSSPERHAAAPPSPSPAPAAKKQTTSLLPAFEPLSSSPALPRPLKRARDEFEESRSYLTPVPTSSTAIFSSSPTRANHHLPPLHCTASGLSERAPLTAVPSIELDTDGKPTRLGRSSVSSDFQLSSNRFISRVHVVACYKPASSSLERDRVEISCSGWNGVQVHCQGNVYDIKKGDTFSSDLRDAEIMLDVHGSRVFIHWPEKPRLAVQALLPSSPPLALGSNEPVHIYEDPDPELSQSTHLTSNTSQPCQATTHVVSQGLTTSVESHPPPEEPLQDFSDNDEENDPIVHSFGPFGANLLPRMASINASGSPQTTTVSKSPKAPLRQNDSPAQAVKKSDFDVKEHVVNQLAFSRLSSTPLSTILSHLPRDAGVMNKPTLKDCLEQIACIGQVTREGKDAAGKPLESEYYYIPEMDEDEHRKEAVVNDLMKPGLRACRKQHKCNRLHTL